MTEKQYDALKEGMPIVINHPFEQNRVITKWIKHNSAHSGKGFIIGSCFYPFKLAEEVVVIVYRGNGKQKRSKEYDTIRKTKSRT